MFDADSRYYNVKTGSISTTDENGQTQLCNYTRRRFLPPLSGQQLVYSHYVQEGDRLDNLAAQYVGDAVQFWRLCDANLVLQPEELVAYPGQSFQISLRQS
jgi:hypothetical protein